MPIRQTDYDLDVPLGLEVSQGKVIEPPVLLNWSNSYLHNNVHITTVSARVKPGDSLIPPRACLMMLRFSRVIIIPGYFFDIKLLILHAREITPVIVPVGKIAGIPHEIRIKNLQDESDVLPFWTRALAGDLVVQAVRLVVYFLISIILLLALVGIITWGTKLNDNWRYGRLIKRFCKSYEGHISKEDKKFFARVLGEPHFMLQALAELLTKKNMLEKKVRAAVNRLSLMSPDDEMAIYWPRARSSLMPNDFDVYQIKAMMRLRLVSGTLPSIKIDHANKRRFLELYDFL